MYARGITILPREDSVMEKGLIKLVWKNLDNMADERQFEKK